MIKELINRLFKKEDKEVTFSGSYENHQFSADDLKEVADRLEKYADTRINPGKLIPEVPTYVRNNTSQKLFILRSIEITKGPNGIELIFALQDPDLPNEFYISHNQFSANYVIEE